ncbi:MAG: anti-sigma factor [Chloroflexaceae bacterium]
MKPSLANNLPESDLELLSAYLDNALSVAERVNLERRLAADPRLRAELEELRATTQLLRRLEPARPPRSFTLDPATAPRPAPVFRLNWFVQLSSGLAGLALVLLATVQLLASTPAAGVVPAASAPTTLDASPMATKTSPDAEMNAPAATSETGVGVSSAPIDDTAPQPEATAPAGSDASQTGAAGASTRESAPEPLVTTSAAQAPPTAPSPPAAASPAFPAGLTLALGIALIALAIGWRLLAR